MAADLHRGQDRKGTGDPVRQPPARNLLDRATSTARTRSRRSRRCSTTSSRTSSRSSGRAPQSRAFGDEVLRIVEACSDSDVHPKPPWRARKEAYLERLATEDERVLLVSASDKLHNARAIVGDLHRQGPALWERFNRDSDQLWYYRSLVSTFRANPEHNVELIDELDRTVIEMERLGAG